MPKNKGHLNLQERGKIQNLKIFGTSFLEPGQNKKGRDRSQRNFPKGIILFNPSKEFKKILNPLLNPNGANLLKPKFKKESPG